MLKKGSLSLGFIILASLVYAQSDSLNSIEFESVKQYKPILKAARKIEIKADIEQNKVKKPVYDYNLPNFVYKVEPNYYPAKAIGIRNDKYEALYDNYFRIGAGNYLTPLIEVRLHNTQNKKYSYGGYAKHLSSNAGKPENADFSDNYIGIEGNKLLKRGHLYGKLNYERHVNHFYGYNHDSFEFKKEDINQIFNDFNGKVGYKKKAGKKLGIQTQFDFYTFSRLNTRENDFMLHFNPLFKLPKKQEIAILSSFDFTNILTDDTTLNRSFVRIAPAYNFKLKKIELKIGAKVVVPIGGISSQFYFYPDITAKVFLVPKKLNAFASFTGDLVKNNLRQLSYINPFINNTINIKNTSNIGFDAGLKGLLGNKFDYLIKVQYQVQKDLPLYVRDSTILNSFDIVYDKINTLAFTTGFGLRINEKFFIQYAATFYNYQTDKQDNPWQLPSFDADINLRYTLAKKLDIRIQLYTMGERKQLIDLISKKTETLSPFLDANIHADYRYKKNISFFLQVNNLANSRYQKWYNYPVFGLNALAGITFSI